MVEFSCQDLLASSEKKASSALANVFETAQRYTWNIVVPKLTNNTDSPNSGGFGLWHTE